MLQIAVRLGVLDGMVPCGPTGSEHQEFDRHIQKKHCSTYLCKRLPVRVLIPPKRVFRVELCCVCFSILIPAETLPRASQFKQKMEFCKLHNGIGTLFSSCPRWANHVVAPCHLVRPCRGEEEAPLGLA